MVILRWFLLISWGGVFFFYGYPAYPSSSSGAYMEFECVGEDQYEVSYHLIRNCLGIAFPDEVSLSASGTGCSFVSFEAERVNIQDITNICAQEQSACDGSTANEGFEKHTYKDTLDLSSQDPSCCQVEITHDRCCRPNLDNLDGNGFGYEATINRCAGDTCVSSPDYDFEPITVLCNEDQVMRRKAPSGSEEDSMVYSLATPLDMSQNPIPWSSGYSAQEPLDYLYQSFGPNQDFPRGFNLDDEGYLKFTPDISGTNFSGQMVIETEQYRNDTLVSRIPHDFQFIIQDCQDPPHAPFPPIPSDFCVTDSVNIEPQFSSASDSVFVDWPLKTFDDASYTSAAGSGSAQGTFLWNPDSSHVNEGPFEVFPRVMVKECTYPRTHTPKIQFNVNKPPDSAYSINPTGECGKVSFSTPEADQIEWTLEGRIASFSQNFEYKFPEGGTYKVTLEKSTPGCRAVILEDSVEVPPYLSLDAGQDTVICEGSSFRLEPEIQHAAGPVDSVKFEVNGREFFNSIEVNPSNDTLLAVKAEDKDGCEARDTIFVENLTLPEVNMEDHNFCADEPLSTINFQAPGYDVEWWNSNDQLLQTGEEFEIPGPGNYVLKARNRILEGCKATDTFAVNQDSAVHFPTTDTSLCPGDKLVQHSGISARAYEWRALPEEEVISTDSLLELRVNKPKQITLNIERLAGDRICQYSDTFSVATLDLPDTSAIAAPEDHCINEGQARLPQNQQEISWSGPGVVQASYWDPSKAGTGQHNLTYNAKHPSSGCTITDSLAVEVLPLPELSVSAEPEEGEEPLTVTFTGNVEEEGTTPVWEIFRDEGGDTVVYEGEFEREHTFYNPGNYGVSFSAAGSETGCRDTITRANLVTVDAAGFLADHLPGDLRLYPNPADDHLLIESPETPVKEVRLYDGRGASILTKKDIDDPMQIELDIGHLEAGVYQVVVDRRDRSEWRGSVVIEE